MRHRERFPEIRQTFSSSPGTGAPQIRDDLLADTALSSSEPERQQPTQPPAQRIVDAVHRRMRTDVEAVALRSKAELGNQQFLECQSCYRRTRALGSTDRDGIGRQMR